MIGKARQRRVVVTESSIYVLEGDVWGTAKSKGVAARHEIRSVPVAYRGRALMIATRPSGSTPSRTAMPSKLGHWTPARIAAARRYRLGD